MLVRDPLLSFAVLSSSAQGRHKRKVVWLLRIFADEFLFRFPLWDIALVAITVIMWGFGSFTRSNWPLYM